MIAFDDLRNNLACIRIAHHIRGRIRLKLEMTQAKHSLPDRNEAHYRHVLERTPGLCSVRINLMARSCVVEYDPAIIPYQAWHDFLNGRDSSSATILEQILREIYQEIINAEL